MDVDPIRLLLEEQILLHFRKCGILASSKYSWERHERKHVKYIVFETHDDKSRRILLQLTLKTDHVLIETDIAPRLLGEMIGAQSDDYQLVATAYYDDPSILRRIKESIRSATLI